MNFPLCIDLDGTLIKTDSFLESFLLLLKKNPAYILKCIVWLFKGGKAYLKHEIALRTQLNVSLLPYTQKLLDVLYKEKAKGRHIVLVTAADHTIAASIADYLNVFSEIIASDGHKNIRGKFKREILNQKFGINQYDYAGNDNSDLKIWPSARAALLVNPASSVIRSSDQLPIIKMTIFEKNNRILNYLKLLRVHQYVKNLLVFFPLIAGHHYLSSQAILDSVLAFIVFCLVASSSYLINDLLDIDNDRQHNKKKERAFAAGDISLSFGLVASPILFIAGLGIATFLSSSFVLCIFSYYLLTLAYSFYLKKKILIDAVILSSLYTIRIISGIIVVQGEFSPWLISFSLFLFLSLAFVKRYAELKLAHQNEKLTIAGRDYSVSDLIQLQIFGIASGYIAVLVLALYLNSNKAIVFYHSLNFLWVICIILLYWISRIWMLAARNVLHDDPIVFTLKDKVSWFLISLSILVFVLSRFL